MCIDNITPYMYGVILAFCVFFFYCCRKIFNIPVEYTIEDAVGVSIKKVLCFYEHNKNLTFWLSYDIMLMAFGRVFSLFKLFLFVWNIVSPSPFTQELSRELRKKT